MRRRLLSLVTVASIAGAMMIITPASAAPINDNFNSAIHIVSPPFAIVQNTSGATMQSHELQPCPTEFEIGATVWFKLSIPKDSLVSDVSSSGGFVQGRAQETGIDVDTRASDFNTAVAIWYPQPWGLEPLGCNDSFEGSDQARLLFGADFGTTYFIQVGGVNGATGNLSFQLRHSVLGDVWKNAIPITAPGGHAISNEHFTLEAQEIADFCAPQESTVWYEFNPRLYLPPDVRASTFGSLADTVITVWVRTQRISDGALSALTFVGCNDGPGNSSEVRFRALDYEYAFGPLFPAPTHYIIYYIQVGTKSGRGPISLTLGPA